MKTRKMLAALAASVLLCGALVMPASAEEAPVYEMGDVNMDGEVTMLDAQLVLTDYLTHVILEGSHTLTDEQLVLADVFEFYEIQYDAPDYKPNVTGIDAQKILEVASLRMVGFPDAAFDNLDQYI